MTLTSRLASAILLTLPILNLPARADEVEVGTALVCDTQQQVERFVTVYDGDAEMAASAVNAEVHDASACAMASIAYVVSPPLATTRSRDATFHIVRILVIGAITEDGLQSVRPTEFFSVLPVDEREA